MATLSFATAFRPSSPSLHEVGEPAVGEHRDMAEDVVEDVRLLQIVEAGGGPDEIAGRELAPGQMCEEDFIGKLARNRDDRPSRAGEEALVQIVEIGDARSRQEQRVEALLEGGGGAAGELAALPGVENVPHPVILGCEALPALRDSPVLRRSRRTGRWRGR